MGGIKCPQTNCLCSFKTKESLHQHLKMMHKQKLDYKLLEIKCNECDFVGYTEKDMEKHRLVSFYKFYRLSNSFLNTRLINGFIFIERTQSFSSRKKRIRLCLMQLHCHIGRPFSCSLEGLNSHFKKWTNREINMFSNNL